MNMQELIQRLLSIGPATVNELAYALQRDYRAVWRMLIDMTERGMIRVSPDRRDVQERGHGQRQLAMMWEVV